MKKITWSNIIQLCLAIGLLALIFLPKFPPQKAETGTNGYKYLGEAKGMRWIDTQVDSMDLRDNPIVKQDAYSTHFLLPDGKIQALFTAFKQNYEMAPGQWEPIDYSLEPSDDPNYDFKTKNGVGIYLSENGSILNQDKNHRVGPPQIGWYDVDKDIFTSVDNLDNPQAVTEKNQLTLQGNGVHIVVYAYDNGAREDLILENRDLLKSGRPWEELVLKTQISAENNVKVNGKSPSSHQELTEKDILEIDSEKGKITLPFPDTWDSKDQHGPIRRFLKNENGGWFLYTTIAHSWLNDDLRVFPITIDPTYSSQPDATSGVDVWLHSGSPTSSQDGDGSLLVGEANVNTVKTHSLVKFDFSSIPSNGDPSSATLSLWQSAEYANNARTISIYPVKRAWVENQATWNNYSTGNAWQTAGGTGANDIATTIASLSLSATEASGEKQWTNFTLASLKDMWDGDFTNNGFLLYNGTDLDDRQDFRSSEYATAGQRPKMVIVYATIPTAPTIGTPTALSSTSIRWALTDNASDETGFKVYDTSDSLVATCATADLTYCDETGLSPNTQYTRKVVAYNGAGNSSYSSTATIYTLANAPSTPTVSSAANSTANIIVAVNSNPAATQFAIQETGSGNYVNKTTGALQASADWGTYVEFGSGSGITVTGLSTNTQYTFKVKARNDDNVETAFGSTAAAYTQATTPSAPTVDVRSSATAQPLTVLAGSNPSGTQLAVYKEAGTSCDGSGGSYLAANGSDNGDTAVWQTAAIWSTVTASGLNRDQQYAFCTVARNGDSIATSFSSAGQYNSCIPNISGNHTITEDCSFPSFTNGNNGSRIIHGVDTGSGSGQDSNTAKITVQSGILTVNANETIVAGSFELAGGSIAIAEGGELLVGMPLWVVDADNDGFPATVDTLYAQLTAPIGGRRRNAMTRISVGDCDDAIAQPYGCFRRPITLTYSGSTLTNYDVLISIDTATPIAAGKMQADCGDIRIQDSDGTTNLTYWIESGCNTSDTQIWARVPSIPDGGKTIYIAYDGNAIANGFESWAGTFTLMYNTTCPAGWTRNADFDSRFPYGTSSYGTTGGASSHSHSQVSCTTGGPSANQGLNSGSSFTGSHPSHTHTSLRNDVDSASSITPPYLDMVMCEKSDLVIPASFIAIFDVSAPSGWTRFSALDSKFPRGATSYGGTGGATTHSHATSGTYTTGNQSAAVSIASACGDAYIAGNHTHDNVPGTTATATNTPPYLDMVFGQKDSQGVAAAGLISMVDSVPPLGWTRFSALDSKFPRGATSYGGTGGATTHSHSVTITSSVGNAPVTPPICVGSYNNAQAYHTHSCTANTDDQSNLPPYTDAIYAKRNSPAASTSLSSEVYWW